MRAKAAPPANGSGAGLHRSSVWSVASSETSPSAAEDVEWRRRFEMVREIEGQPSDVFELEESAAWTNRLRQLGTEANFPHAAPSETSSSHETHPDHSTVDGNTSGKLRQTALTSVQLIGGRLPPSDFDDEQSSHASNPTDATPEGTGTNVRSRQPRPHGVQDSRCHAACEGWMATAHVTPCRGRASKASIRGRNSLRTQHFTAAAAAMPQSRHVYSRSLSRSKRSVTASQRRAPATASSSSSSLAAAESGIGTLPRTLQTPEVHPQPPDYHQVPFDAPTAIAASLFHPKVATSPTLIWNSNVVWPAAQTDASGVQPMPQMNFLPPHLTPPPHQPQQHVPQNPQPQQHVPQYPQPQQHVPQHPQPQPPQQLPQHLLQHPQQLPEQPQQLPQQPQPPQQLPQQLPQHQPSQQLQPPQQVPQYPQQLPQQLPQHIDQHRSAKTLQRSAPQLSLHHQEAVSISPRLPAGLRLAGDSLSLSPPQPSGNHSTASELRYRYGRSPEDVRRRHSADFSRDQLHHAEDRHRHRRHPPPPAPPSSPTTSLHSSVSAVAASTSSSSPPSGLSGEIQLLHPLSLAVDRPAHPPSTRGGMHPLPLLEPPNVATEKVTHLVTAPPRPLSLPLPLRTSSNPQQQPQLESPSPPTGKMSRPSTTSSDSRQHPPPPLPNPANTKSTWNSAPFGDSQQLPRLAAVSAFNSPPMHSRRRTYDLTAKAARLQSLISGLRGPQEAEGDEGIVTEVQSGRNAFVNSENSPRAPCTSTAFQESFVPQAPPMPTQKSKRD